MTRRWARAVAVTPLPAMLSTVSILDSVACARNVVCEHVVRSPHALPTTSDRRLGDGLVVQLVLRRDTTIRLHLSASHISVQEILPSPHTDKRAPYVHLQLVHVATAGL